MSTITSIITSPSNSPRSQKSSVQRIFWRCGTVCQAMCMWLALSSSSLCSWRGAMTNMSRTSSLKKMQGNRNDYICYVFISNHSLDVFTGNAQEQCFKHIVIEWGVIVAGPVAVRGKGDLQQFWLHVLRVDHDVNPINGPGGVFLHLRVFNTRRDEDTSQHFFNFLMNLTPLMLLVMLFKVLYKLFIRNLLKILNVSIIHDCELSLIIAECPLVDRIWLIGATNPEVFIQKQGQRQNWLNKDDVPQINFHTSSGEGFLDILLSNFGSCFHGFDDCRQVVGDDHIHGPCHIGWFDDP